MGSITHENDEIFPDYGTSINVLNQDDLTNDYDAEFWQSIGAIEDNKLIEVIADKQLVFPLEEVPSTPEPKQNKTD